MKLPLKIGKSLKKDEISEKGIETKNFSKSKINKKVIGAICLLLIAGAGFTIYKVKFAKKRNTVQSSVKYTNLEKTNIATSISSSGAIKSGDSTNIYSNLEYNVASINVEVGDVVKKGDVLATIDTTTLEEEIAEAQQTLTANQAKNQAALAQSQKNYDNAKYLYDNNLNTNIVSAETTLNKDKLALDESKKTYEYKNEMLKNGSESQDNVNQAQISYENEQKACNQDEVSLEAAKLSAQKEIENYKAALDSAQAVVNDKTAQLALQDKKKKLQDAQVIATVDGTVTNVNAVVGVQASGALFVIQDLSNLIVNASVDETNVANVKAGQRAEITTDASGSNIIAGQVVSVEPVSSTASASTSSTSSSSSNSKSSTSTSTTSNSTSSDVSFTVKVQLTGQNDKVKVGMNSVVNIITDEKSDIYSVPYAAVINNNGQSEVYAAEKQGGQYVVKEIPVTKGIESAANVEIEGTDLSDGMIILNDPSNISPGSTVPIKLK
ncbi:efflux RND transporter periplasmic adaptor subunit [Clostridium saccharobutylicum]|uniref:Secretion protein HlyD family protein n=1 Tax=Clostridium saccharobutylicum DSM 13864 TaxID=1345695 RepID=U5MRK8_CLOSA|nr:efflux RND transporter periplasmic adaptor subunit [Clostridium saccharobutylicum]AGX42062.1 secretion protein HlyD family protein [Clostridium saccharobutylicum DSM 13864]AQR89341.1 multidrug resistance protein MdtN [Clostridium saccharobutylicum]AQR99242.1 multidrug resistance protein MdtN [Clostridium saccharobutylicum]AQS13230.1 multidrug resistance protein MdtN [Clostridium saccharobutylicum]MBA2907712.1 multidrug resistance efflux pump [Clostridium saccharobutylicum]